MKKRLKELYWDFKISVFNLYYKRCLINRQENGMYSLTANVDVNGNFILKGSRCRRVLLFICDKIIDAVNTLRERI